MFLFRENAQLAWLTLVPIPLLVAGALAYTLTAHRRYRLQRKASSAMNALLHDNLAGIRQIKTYVREREEHERFNGVSNQLREATLMVMRVWSIYNPSMTFFGAVGGVLVLGFGGQAVLAHQMTIGQLAGFLFLVGFLYEPMGAFTVSISSSRAGGPPASGSLRSWMNRLSPAAWNTRNDQLIPRRRSFSESQFCLLGGTPGAARDFPARQARRGVALVGATGAGKSTLVNLLTRFYEFDSGEICIDDRPLRDFRKALCAE